MKINIQNASLSISAGNFSQFPTDPIPQIAFSGRSNVGKSSIINSLLSRKSLAHVSGSPGKTITINFYSVDKKLFFVDLPGYGYAKRAEAEKRKWSALTDGYFTRNVNSHLTKLVVQLVDSRIGPTDDDKMMLSYLAGAGIPHIIVATKCDKLNRTERNSFTECIENCNEAKAALSVIMCSSKNGEGKDALWSEIYKYAFDN